MSVDSQLIIFYFIIGFLAYVTFVLSHWETRSKQKWWEPILVFLIIELFWPLAGI